MTIETKHGEFKLIKNTKDAFEKEVFEERYIPEALDRYEYILGDISANVLRLKGFNEDLQEKYTYEMIPDFLIESCAFGCPYFILKRHK